MEIDISDTDRIAGNADVLSTVETEIVSLEQMFAGIESLKTEKDRLSAAVQNLTAEETRTLGDDAVESVIVKKLIEIRARRDVQNARLAGVEDRLKEQTAALAVQGETVRRAFARILAQVWLVRQARATASLSELFGGPIRLQAGRIELRELTRHTSLMRQLRDVDNRLCHPIADPVQETAALQRARIWLTEIKNLIEGEPGLTLRLPKPQPIEEPREMVTA
jgi:hypothetical protein